MRKEDCRNPLYVILSRELYLSFWKLLDWIRDAVGEWLLEHLRRHSR